MTDDAKKLPPADTPEKDDVAYWKFGNRPEKDKENKDAFVSPIFDAHAGERMRLVRMKRLWDQAELGEQLGISQTQVSKIEMGKLKHVEITMEKFKAVFGAHHKYILYSTYMGEFNPRVIHTKYWEARLQLRRKNKSDNPYREGAKKYKLGKRLR